MAAVHECSSLVGVKTSPQTLILVAWFKESTLQKCEKMLCFYFFFVLSLFPEQHWGRVRAYGRRRGYVQSVPHPSQEPEDSGCRCDDHPPESRHKAWDLVGSDHQLLDQRFKFQICKGEEGFRLNFRFYVLVKETVGSGLGQRDPSSVCGGRALAWGDSGTESELLDIKVRVGS